MSGIRYANIGVAVATTIIGAGVLLFRDSSDAAIQAVGVVGLVAGAVVYAVLEERATRRDEKRPQ